MQAKATLLDSAFIVRVSAFRIKWWELQVQAKHTQSVFLTMCLHHIKLIIS